MILRTALIFSASAFCANASFAEVYTAELTTAHEIAARWKSQQTGGATAQVVLSDDGTRLDLELMVTGVTPQELAAAGPEGVLGSMHIHNLPQGGPNFFALQLPGTIEPTVDGFKLVLTDWKIEPPKGGAKVDAAFVVGEIKSGNAYIGLHTTNLLCQDGKGNKTACAAPATALSGQIVKAAD